ncbi:MAG: hypothetical protein ACKO4Z_06785, partial [Planctomycetota bacterium]
RAAGPTHGGGIVPKLGTARAAAMAKVAPGLERLVRCVGVLMGDGEAAAGRHAIFLIEPATTGASGRKCLVEILSEPLSATALLRALADSLTLAAGAGSGHAAAVSAGYVIAPQLSHEGQLMADAAVSGALATLICGLGTLAEAAVKCDDD